MIEKIERYIRKQRLVLPGDRVAAAVSGGADSVALLRLLLELRKELGVVLTVAHFHHQIRGQEADADQQFVQDLAKQFGLDFFCGSGDAPAHARKNKLSLETAARELRHAWFAQLVGEGKADKVATAHTQNDQAETVLMRMLRGAGTRGLAGIAPWQKEKALVRPLLCVTREEVETYLKSLRQPWHEDSSNQDFQHSRNRIRGELLPLLERSYNPAVRETLADVAEVARAEEEYWQAEVDRLLGRLLRSGKPSRSGRSQGPGQPAVLAVDLAAFHAAPLAVQRRVLRAVGERLGTILEFKHIQELIEFAQQEERGKRLSLPGGLTARTSFRELQFGRQEPAAGEYKYALPIPGEVAVPELGIALRARVVSLSDGNKEVSGYNSALLLARALLAPEVTVRNWRSGDRFFPAHTRSPKKVKELLQSGRPCHNLSPAERKAWPVIENAGEIVWMRGFPVPQAFNATSGQAVWIEEVTLNSGMAE